MKLNLSKQAGGHHLPCLSGLSQSPLITDNGGGERSTQISAHSLSLNSPTTITTSTASLHHTIGPHDDDHNHQPASRTPQLPHSSALINISGSASVFFPPLPPRLSSNKVVLTNEAIVNGFNATTTPNGGSISCGHLKNDVNMNAEHERNREASRQHASSLSTSQNIASPKRAQTVQSSNSPGVLNSPASAISKPFFFPESHNLFALHKQQARRPSGNSQQPSAPTSVVSTPRPNSDPNDWSKLQDDTYHLYHEPIDTDEQVNQLKSQTKSKNNSPLIRPTPLITVDKFNQIPTTPKTRSNISATNLGLKDWSAANNSEQHSNQQESQQQRAPTSFADRASSFRNDVSADIYRQYVTTGSSERADPRSRSYHGPKNSNGMQSRHSPPPSSVLKTPKNLSSTSVTELSMSPVSATSPTQWFLFRNHCVRELIDTEYNYVHALGMIVTSFAQPLEPFLKREDYQLIFGHIRDFHHIHTVFHANLFEAARRANNKDLPKIPSPQRNTINGNQSTPTSLSNNSPRISNGSPLSSPKDQDVAKDRHSRMNSLKISTCFINSKEKFLKYGEYCATLTKAQALLDDLTNKSELIAAQLDRSQHEVNEGKFKLRDLLSLPMQRILKYHLLLEQLIKSTSPTHEDYHGLKRAHEAMVDIGKYINEVKRDTEVMQIINEVEHSIVGLNMPSSTQLIDYGRLVTDGFIRIKAPQDPRLKTSNDSKIKLPHDTKITKRYVFVFDKVMLVCKVSVRGHQYKEALVLSEYELEVDPKDETFFKHTTKDKWSFNFNLMRTSDKTIYSFYAKTQEMKNKWINAILKAMDNIRPSVCRNIETHHEFLMHTFDKASSCDHCGKLLLGLYYQGYRCRICFTSVHKKCLTTTRSCGPNSRPKQVSSGLQATHSHQRSSKCNEPPSPSVRSNCTDDGQNNLINFPPSNLPGSQCIDAPIKHEYSNLVKRLDTMASSFRENCSRGLPNSQRPVLSMVNVSSQNSTNPIPTQKRLLKPSTSTPAISHRAALLARATSNFVGDESLHELQLLSGDLILIQRDSLQLPTLDDGITSPLSRSMVSQKKDIIDSLWLYGKNTRTGKEGRFPPEVVEIHNDVDALIQEKHESTMHLDTNNSIGNFILDDRPWFCGRMDRDQAQQLLENEPHGTFLVRLSPKHNGGYVISLNYKSQVKHMRIYVSADNKLFLSQNRLFSGVCELVTWYENNSLVESFHMLDARLAIPFKQRA